jgi:hypothetical protein
MHIKKQPKKKSSKESVSPIATLGGFLVAINLILLIFFTVNLLRSNSFDSIIYIPTVLILVGLFLIKASGVNSVKMLRAVLYSVVELLFPFF